MRALLVAMLVSMVLQAQIVPPARAQAQISGERFQALIVKQVAPEYPTEAVALNIMGDVILAVQLGDRGNLQTIKAVRGPAMLREAAMKAVMQWRFRPYVREGIAVSVRSEVVVHFPPE